MATAGAFTLHEWLAIVGAICAFGGLASNIVRNRNTARENRRSNDLKERELSLKEREVAAKWADINMRKKSNSQGGNKNA